jgi:hypothetical protein
MSVGVASTEPKVRVSNPLGRARNPLVVEVSSKGSARLASLGLRGGDGVPNPREAKPNQRITYELAWQPRADLQGFHAAQASSATP